MQLSSPSDCILLFYAIINRMICAYQIRFLFNSSTYSADLLYSSVNLRSPASGGAKDVEHECERSKVIAFLRDSSQTPYNAYTRLYNAPLVAPLRVAPILQVGRKTITERQTTCNGVLIVYFRPSPVVLRPNSHLIRTNCD